MQLHNIKPVHKLKKSHRIGRGGKRGGYSGRGIKGQKSRAGAKIRPAIRDLMMKLPKLRGQGGGGFRSFKTKPRILNLDVLEKHFDAGELVNHFSLAKKGLVSKRSGKMFQVKILGEGALSKKLTFSGVLLSTSARAKIEKAGGSIKESVISGQPEVPVVKVAKPKSKSSSKAKK